MSWLQNLDASERRWMLGLLLSGLIASGYTCYAAWSAWRRAFEERARQRPRGETPLYVRPEPAATGPVTVALGVGALRAVDAGEPVDAVDFRRPRREIVVYLRDQLTEGGADDGIDRTEAAREHLPRALRALLGSQAEVVAPGLRLVEEALRQRVRVGPELWAHALEEYATARGLPFAEREGLLSLAGAVTRAEDRLRTEGVLRDGDRIPSLLVMHWADGVHLVRCGLRTRWLSDREGHEYLERAATLTVTWYDDWRTVLAAQLLPSFITDDEAAIRRGITAARHLLTDEESPLREGFPAAPLRESPSSPSPPSSPASP